MGEGVREGTSTISPFSAPPKDEKCTKKRRKTRIKHTPFLRLLYLPEVIAKSHFVLPFKAQQSTLINEKLDDGQF